MTRRNKLILLYLSVAVLCSTFIALMVVVGRNIDATEKQDPFVNSGREEIFEWFPISTDLAGTNQDGEEIRLSSSRGKVTVINEFFTLCPTCMFRSGIELLELYDTFKDDPNFLMVSISIDPSNDSPGNMRHYARNLGAGSRNWWFLNAGDARFTHDYLEKELKFFAIRERTDPLEIEALGRYSHDMGYLLVNPGFTVIGKWPLFEAGSEEARSRDPHLYQHVKDELYRRIREELAKVAAESRPASSR
ncbi:SCO family protein [Luteolibacter sp. Populi]|uniref:SCO family protein n=1 Tax=Luteolibacter sp. Populi TaxID=3230487 RepID=UPI0034677DAF